MAGGKNERMIGRKGASKRQKSIEAGSHGGQKADAKAQMEAERHNVR